MNKNKIFLLFCFAFVGGVIIASVFDFSREYLYLFIGGLIFVITQLFFWKNYKQRLVIFIIVFLFLGITRYVLFKPIIDKNHIAYYNEQSQEFIGQITTEPDVRIGYVNYIVEVKDNRQGRVQIKTKLYPRYSYGEIIKIKCKLQAPKNFNKFNYQKYLARYKVYSVCYYPIINTVKGSLDFVSFHSTPLEMTEEDIQSNGLKIIFFKKIYQFKKIIANRIDQLWSEPKASFMAGLLYGSRSGLPAELTENFNRTGITHIIAISGYNITIIVVVMMSVLINAGFYRQQAFWINLIGIFLFVIFTGGSASVTRAAIMGSLVLLGQYLGRLSQIGSTMMLALVIMLIINPLVLFYDAGFQLSFIATLGLVYISPKLESGLKKNWVVNHPIKFYQKILDNLITVLTATLSAIIATLPLILYQFGRLSIVAPLANVLILWIIPFLMLLGFLAVILSFIFYPLGLLIAYLAGLGLDYIIFITNTLGELSWASVELEIPLILTMLLYVFMLIYFYPRKL